MKVEISPEEQVGILIEEVEELIANGSLNNGNGNALNLNLERALSYLSNGYKTNLLPFLLPRVFT